MLDDGWGWSSGRVVGLLAASAILVAVFLARSSRHPSPVIEIGLLGSRSFAVASLATFLFGAALGGMLLSSVLWVQNIWHWSALQSGLAILPGPALVPIWSAVAGRLIPRFGPGPVVAGSTAFAVGVAWWAAAIGLRPNYVTGMLAGMSLTGVGVGLAMPTLLGAAASSLPPQRFAAGSGVVNMVRQIGLTVGVAVLVAVTGTPHTAAGQLTAFQRAWVVLAAIALAAGLTGYLLRRPQAAVKVPAEHITTASTIGADTDT
ncbi:MULTISPECIES: MFS transporter [Micromonospora]|uniref:MFS transporter n=1 Tax=Micromonospora TaxID=1873 RepID=UPI001374EE6B|nr:MULTISPECIES: MFS transporter [unclassified Micromonospora]MBM0227491.1 MFS transporter [Micromonospora sp. ATA51]